MPHVSESPLTPGLIRALSKQKVRRLCACGFPMPVYPGRYPSKCPICSNARDAEAEPDDGEGTAS